jgi:hypothetical protein
MDDFLEEQFDKVVTSLNAVISSTTQNNPSIADAEKLVEEDERLHDALESRLSLLHHHKRLLTSTVVTHQENYSRISILRDLEKKLDDQIKAIVQILADTRQELKKAKFTEYSEGAKRVQFDELLRFAKSIAKFTAPPGYTFPELTSAPNEDEAASTDDKKDTGWNAVLTDQQKTDLDQFASLPFVPWPHEGRIRNSLLSQIQETRDNGLDPNASAQQDQEPTSTIHEDFPDHPVQPERLTSTQRQPRPVQPAFEGFDF